MVAEVEAVEDKASKSGVPSLAEKQPQQSSKIHISRLCHIQSLSPVDSMSAQYSPVKSMSAKHGPCQPNAAQYSSEVVVSSVSSVTSVSSVNSVTNENSV